MSSNVTGRKDGRNKEIISFQFKEKCQRSMLLISPPQYPKTSPKGGATLPARVIGMDERLQREEKS
ncbi:hypothetical protein AKJ62_01610 [candidate division MSBL1 archaeon SCGC-AAA259D14]|uniref:Uncharacterized protein n=1 Tax=candidate division MSBL1 archaeon SCGC-AAA259D14 TaxID=1698261 RepID=A0A133U7H8_9EURY|nr:hypothetical protein AKJ62_01610 [candidate division MSBL1 archaeon SCGC-AAA259D14]